MVQDIFISRSSKSGLSVQLVLYYFIYIIKGIVNCNRNRLILRNFFIIEHILEYCTGIIITGGPPYVQININLATSSWHSDDDVVHLQYSLITSTKEVMFLLDFVCLSVC